MFLKISKLFVFAFSLSLATLPLERASWAAEMDPDANYDRLDGKGSSRKKVNVIEWEGNLEIHVYPAGSLKGLALKLDKKNKDKPVMVIGYRFDSDPKKTLIRRAILGIPLNEGFTAYKDPAADGYDKIVITQNELGKPLAHFKLDPPPSQLYPEGHPALAQNGEEKREPASESKSEEAVKEKNVDEESGTIRPFFRAERSPGRTRD